MEKDKIINAPKPIKVLIIDDSVLVRETWSEGLSEDPAFDVVGAISDVFGERDIIAEKEADIIILDIDMAKMDGIEFLRRMMPQNPTPVITSCLMTQKGKHNTLIALESGAVDFIGMPVNDVARGLRELVPELKSKIKVAYQANLVTWKNRNLEPPQRKLLQEPKNVFEPSEKVIAIGSSIGGIEALRKLFTKLPSDMPGIIVAQHLPIGFTKTFADRLNQFSDMLVKEAETGDRVLKGSILIAPGDLHMKIVRVEDHFEVACEMGEKVNDQRPSVEVLLMSVAEHVGPDAVGVILTGNGKDGAVGLRAMKNIGAKTIVQDEATSVFYSMPKAAIDMGAVDMELSLDEIAVELIKMFT
ncbi:MAG: chemotaxis-specific protein-glutamate methyltransferase CheB [FCB group bacterium]|jgi:two-component system chemotaxis response regulator CheB